jgi:AraC-like DNA-binding protein
MGVVGPALAHATHLDAALDVLVRIMGHFAKNAGFVRVDTDLGAGIAYKMPTLRSRHGPDTVFAAAMSLMRHCTGMPLKAAALDHQMPRCQPDEYAKHFGVAARWDQPISQLIFAKKDLSLPFRGASPQLAELLVANVPRLMSPDAQTSSFEQELEQAFWSAHQHGEATLETAAEVLGTSARTLQRRLGTMGTTFAEQRAVFLQRRAMTLLREDTTPIETIAERLGYGSRAAFERAFMRWTGKTPHAARLEAQQG